MPQFDFKSMVEDKELYEIILTDETIVLPKTMPAKVMLQFFDKDRKEMENMNEQEQARTGFALIEALMGEEKWEKVMSEVGVDYIRPLMEDILDYYGFGPKAEGEAGEGEEGKAVEASQSPSTISSTTSEPSTATSNGSSPSQEESSTQESSPGSSSSPVSDISPPTQAS